MLPFTGCGYCGGRDFNEGPRGGLSVNITCRGCGARYNVLFHPLVPPLLINELSGPAPEKIN